MKHQIPCKRKNNRFTFILLLAFVLALASCSKEIMNKETQSGVSLPQEKSAATGPVAEWKELEIFLNNLRLSTTKGALVNSFGQPVWHSAIKKGVNPVQWFVPFSGDQKTVSAVMVIEKTSQGYKYQFISSGSVRTASPENAKPGRALLAYFNHRVFNAGTAPGLTAGPEGRFPLTIVPGAQSNENISTRWEVYETCITTNLNCNCPSWYPQCDLCSQCLRTDCWESWIWNGDETEYVGPGGGGESGGGGTGNSGEIGFLAYNLGLTQDRIAFLSANPALMPELYHYLIGNPTEEARQICRDHIGRMMNDPAYLQFVQGHLVSGAVNTVWWTDGPWLDNPNNFNLDITRANNQYDPLTLAEIALIKIYPLQAYVIKQNVNIALAMSDAKMGVADTLGLNDKKDAFRHAFFQAINTRDVPPQIVFPIPIPGNVIVTLFANAHESEVPAQLQLEKEMDLFNNSIGINYCLTCWITSNNSIADAIMIKLVNGELKYLTPLNFTFSPRWPTGLNGIYSSTTLKWTNQ